MENVSLANVNVMLRMVATIAQHASAPRTVPGIAVDMACVKLSRIQRHRYVFVAVHITGKYFKAKESEQSRIWKAL